MPRETSLEGVRCCSDRAAGRAPPGRPGGLRAPQRPRWVSPRFPQRSERRGSPTCNRSVLEAESTAQRRAARSEEPLSPRSAEQGPEQPREGRRLPAGHPAALRPGCGGSGRAPGSHLRPVTLERLGRATQKPLPSRDRVAVAILTCSEQAHRTEAAGDLPPLCGGRALGTAGVHLVSPGHVTPLPAGFPDTNPGSQRTA